jgi:hypothetical protein
LALRAHEGYPYQVYDRDSIATGEKN